MEESFILQDGHKKKWSFANPGNNYGSVLENKHDNSRIKIRLT